MLKCGSLMCDMMFPTFTGKNPFILSMIPLILSFAVCIGFRIASLIAFHLDDAVDLMLLHAVETVVFSLLTAAVTFALMLFHVWIRFFLISAAFALILSQFW